MTISQELKKAIEEPLRSRDGYILGCRRRNIWAPSASFRHNRGNALLAMAGEKYSVHGPTGEPIDFWLYRNHYLMMFRAGEWKQYWSEDFNVLWAYIDSCWDIGDKVLVVHENKGKLNVVELGVSKGVAYDALEKALEDLRVDPPGRLAKNTPRAYHVCRFCPVKQRCDAMDQLRGETDDWGANYKK